MERPAADMIAARVVRASAARRLAQAGVASPDHDADALLATILSVDRVDLYRVDELTDDQAHAYFALIERRSQRVPLQHLTGVAGFRYLDLEVGPGVFVPRPETELLVQWGLDHLKTATAFGRCVVVDLCAGSGAIALSVAHEAPAAQVYAVERDGRALSWAQRNAEARAAAGDLPITLCRGDATSSAVLPHLDGIIDLVLANPPYIPDGRPVDPEVADHDPPAALWGGPDGLAVVRGVTRRAWMLLRPGGWYGVEHADDQGESVPATLDQMGGWAEIEDHRDLTGRARYTTARRR